jgi:hypothetical protein
MPTLRNTTYKLNNWELLIIFIGFIAIVCLVISVYAAQIKEKFYPWGAVAYGGPWGGPVSGGPWNIPTRYPIRGWGWDIRGYPAPYYLDYPYGGYLGGQPAYPAPQPDGSNSTSSANTKSGNPAPFGIEMTKPSPEIAPTKPSTANTTKPSTTKNNIQSANNKLAQNEVQAAKNMEAENQAAEEWYEKESRWWPDWISWPWRPYFNYGLHYDVNGKLKPSDNDSIVANHSWAWW